MSDLKARWIEKEVSIECVTLRVVRRLSVEKPGPVKTHDECESFLYKIGDAFRKYFGRIMLQLSILPLDKVAPITTMDCVNPSMASHGGRPDALRDVTLQFYKR